MDDATLTPLFNYHYRISAPPGVNGVRLREEAGRDFRTRYHIGFRH